MSYILEQARALQDKMVAWRRDIHMHPETSFTEVRTANLVAEELRRLGMEIEVGVGKTGVVGHLGDGSKGPVIGIRADMDALPIHELNDVPYASTIPGKMHACGHDAHTAMLIGVANILNAMPDRPAGEIRFLFQPSEEDQDPEGQSGATRMIADNALVGVDAVIALHVDSQLKVGKVELASGAVSAAADKFEARIIGRGGHGASPHKTVDPIFIAAHIITAMYGIRARRVHPLRPAVVTVGMIHGGTASNVIPDDVTIQGTLRSYDEETRQQLLRDVEDALKLSQVLGGDYEYHYKLGYPSMYNDPAVCNMLQMVTTDFFGSDTVRPQEPMMGAEDFSFMQRIAPGAMFMLGAQIGDDDRPHHNPIFNIDESVFYQGAAILAETAVRLLREKA
jgi:amidohydrolase